MGGDQRNMSVCNSNNDHGRDVYVEGGGNMYIAVRGRGGLPPSYHSRDNLSNNNWRASSHRGRSRVPDGHWRGGGRGHNEVRGGGNSVNRMRAHYSRNSGGPSNRRPPPPRYDDLLTVDTDHRIDRQQARQEMWRGGRGGRRGTNSRFRLERSANQHNIGLLGWQKVSIYDAANHGPGAVMDEVTAMVGETFDYHLLASEGTNVTFYIEDSPSVGKSLLELSKRLAMPNSTQRHTIAVTPTNNPPFQPPTPDNLEKVKVLMAQRYSIHLTRLDLSEFHKDNYFRSKGLLFPLYVQSNLASVGRLIVANVPHVTEVDLSRNKLIGLETIAVHLQNCANLTRLNLSNNKLTNISRLFKLRGLGITELSVEGNPLCNRYKNIEDFISDVRDIFPKLLVLDGKELPRPIGFEVDDGDVTIPPFKPSYFCDDRAREIVVIFLKQYYELFDSADRSGLSAAYCEDAIFSMSTMLPENGPRAMPLDNETLPNRNLKVRCQVEDRMELLFRGRVDVMNQIVNRLPPTTHDLDSFVVDVPIAKPQLLKVVISGVYRRGGVKNKSVNTRAFQRSLIVVPEGQGFCIANEQLYVTLATFDQIKTAFQSSSGSSAPSTSTATPAPVGLEPQQIQMIEQFSAKSSMLPEFSKTCLEQNAWDFDKAADLFVRLKNEGIIPDEYFKK